MFEFIVARILAFLACCAALLRSPDIVFFLMKFNYDGFDEESFLCMYHMLAFQLFLLAVLIILGNSLLSDLRKHFIDKS